MPFELVRLITELWDGEPARRPSAGEAAESLRMLEAGERRRVQSQVLVNWMFIYWYLPAVA
jgi:hypothetical protein